MSNEANVFFLLVHCQEVLYVASVLYTEHNRELEVSSVSSSWHVRLCLGPITILHSRVIILRITLLNAAYLYIFSFDFMRILDSTYVAWFWFVSFWRDRVWRIPLVWCTVSPARWRGIHCTNPVRTNPESKPRPTTSRMRSRLPSGRTDDALTVNICCLLELLLGYFYLY